MSSAVINYRKANPSDSPDIAKILVDTWKSTYSDLVSEEVLNKRNYEYVEPRWRERIDNLTEKDIIFVAEKEDKEIIGMTWGRTEKYNVAEYLTEIDKYEGELLAIYVLKDYQQQYIGKTLVSRVVEFLLNHNVRSMIVWVFKDNPAKEFYRKLGAKYIGDRFLELDGEKYLESVYGWESIEDIRFSF
ncbi:MAG: GNAT family N-acetyltransferase [Promethearchaeota archaeon]|nr:MAG: GNAT family N-acetyltransferase [Candidatus Lokiarchaeota archaeon]